MGLPHTDPISKVKGWQYFNLDFSTTLHKSFYKGDFVNGLFEGKGELFIANKEDFNIDMPLVLTDRRDFSRIHFKPNTSF